MSQLNALCLRTRQQSKRMSGIAAVHPPRTVIRIFLILQISVFTVNKTMHFIYKTVFFFLHAAVRREAVSGVQFREHSVFLNREI